MNPLPRPQIAPSALARRYALVRAQSLALMLEDPDWDIPVSIAARGRQLLARTSRRVRPGPIANVRVKLTKHGRRVLRGDRRRLKLTLRASLRLPSGASTKRKATAKLR